MPGVPDQAVTELETAVATFRQRLVPTTIDDAVDAAVTKFRQKFQADGIDVTPADVLKNFEHETRAQYDVTLRADAAALKAALDDNARAMAATIETVAQLPDPLAVEDGTPASETLHEIKRTRILLELDRCERKLCPARCRPAVSWLFFSAPSARPLLFSGSSPISVQ
jgi:hypothetical protein